MRRYILGLMLVLISAAAYPQTYNLHFFVKQGDYDNVAHYINRNEDVNQYDDNGYTPLMYAADLGRNDLVKLLMDNGAEPNCLPLYDNEPPALHAAVLMNKPETVDLLLQYERTKVDLRDSAGHTALLYAVSNGFLENADVLLFHGANPDIVMSDSMAALHVAAALNDTAMISLLIRNGAYVNLKSGSRTPFSVAVEYASMDAARILVENGADPKGGYPVHYAAQYADAATLDYLHSLGLDMNGNGAGKHSPRDIAVLYDNRPVAARIAGYGGKNNCGLLFRYLSVSAIQEFCRREYRLGMSLGIHEQRTNMALYIGGSLRPAYKPALVQQTDHLYYQLRERRRMAHATLEKRLSLRRGLMPDFGASLAYEFAIVSGKYDGALDMKPDSETLHVPCLGIYGRFRNFGISAGYKHYGYSNALEAPVNVVNISLTGYIGIARKTYRPFDIR